MKSEIVLGVDIGGSHITAKLVDLSTGCAIEESEEREHVNAKGTATEIIAAWSGVIQAALEKTNTTAHRIGIAMPGPFDYENGIAWMQNQDKYDALYGLNIKELLAKELELSSHSIRFMNDAEAFLKGEVFNGAARTASKAIGITLGTGLGSAKCINDVTEDANLWCSPFLNGIAEDYLSTRWFVKRYFELSGKTLCGVKELAILENDDASQVFDEFGSNLALFLSGDAIAKEDPEVIVLGGNIANAFSRFAVALNAHFKQAGNGCSIKKALLGEEAALIGAASSWRKAELSGTSV